eukprot:363159-Chlamydomonas_euryale.AAC.13
MSTRRLLPYAQAKHLQWSWHMPHSDPLHRPDRKAASGAALRAQPPPPLATAWGRMRPVAARPTHTPDWGVRQPTDVPKPAGPRASGGPGAAAHGRQAHPRQVAGAHGGR